VRLNAAFRRSLACALVGLALSGPRVVRADESAADLEAARAAFKEASSLAEQKRWSAACDRYAYSLKLHRAALTLYSLGVAQREAGRLVAARASFQAFLAEPATATTQSYVEPARSAIAELRTRIATLVIVLVPGPVPAATVTIDGVALPPGTLAQRQAVDPGAHDIVARAPGRAEARAHLTLPEGGWVTQTLTLTPQASSAGAGSPPLADPPADGKPETPDGPKPRGERWPRALPIGLLAGGGAAIAGGVTLGLVGLADAHSAPSATGPAASDARTKGIAGDVLAGTGIAAAGVGLVLLLVQKTHPTLAGTAPWLRSDGTSVSVSF
jgi:hypothetical protein